ncbi:MAG TPA: DUF222 domain-containing protein [Acidimicrobiales bacterium]|nr:DUF222 domain-containing protein [Acidimicrobiales bacterium]
MDLSLLSEAVDEMLAAPDRALADGETVLGLFRIANKVSAALARAASAFEDSGEWGSSGARSAQAWMARRSRLDKSTCSRALIRGRRLHYAPLTAEAWAEGEIGEDHVRVLLRLARGRTVDAFADSEEMLVGFARTLRFDEFARRAAYWESVVDPDGTDASEEARRARRDHYLVRSIDGMFFGRTTLDPISGTIVAEELSRLEKEEFEADWAEAKERLDIPYPVTADLRRTPGQRRADALVRMATRSKIAPADGRRPAPLFTVLVGYETLHGRICQLASGTVISPGGLLPWLTEAHIERAVFTPKGRVEISETARLFTGATRRAIEVRDRECFHPYCDTSGSRCQVDHVIPHAAGGPTTQDNGRLACGFHNRARNKGSPDKDEGARPPNGAPPDDEDDDPPAAARA